MNLLGLKAYFADNQRMISITICAVVTAGDKDTVQQGSSGYGKIQLVPVMRSGVSPGNSVVGLGGEECVGYAEVVVRA